MLRALICLLSLVCLAVMGVLTVSCGSSNSTTTTVCHTVYNVVGDWQITVTDNGGGTVTGYGAIDSAGLALFFDNTPPLSSGDTVELPTLSGNCSFSGNILAYSEPGGPANGSLITDASQGNVNSTTSISGTFTGTGGNPSGTISLSPFPPLNGPVTAINAQKTGAVQGAINGQPVLLALNFTPSGSNSSMSFATDPVISPNCSVTGTFTEVGTNNVFDVSTTFAGTSCPMTGTFSGLGFEASTDYFNINGNNPDTYLYANVLASSNTFVMEVF